MQYMKDNLVSNISEELDKREILSVFNRNKVREVSQGF